MRLCKQPAHQASRSSIAPALLICQHHLHPMASSHVQNSRASSRSCLTLTYTTPKQEPKVLGVRPGCILMTEVIVWSRVKSWDLCCVSASCPVCVCSSGCRQYLVSSPSPQPIPGDKPETCHNCPKSSEAHKFLMPEATRASCPTCLCPWGTSLWHSLLFQHLAVRGQEGLQRHYV